MSNEILANNMGDIRRSYNKPVADNQAIKKGDPVTVAAGLVSKAAVSATAITGFAEETVTTTTGYNTPTNPRPRAIYDTVNVGQQFKGILKNATAAPTDTSLEGTDAGLIVEDGIYKIDTGAANKILTIVKVVEPFDSKLVVFHVKTAARQGE